MKTKCGGSHRRDALQIKCSSSKSVIASSIPPPPPSPPPPPPPPATKPTTTTNYHQPATAAVATTAATEERQFGLPSCSNSCFSLRLKCTDVTSNEKEYKDNLKRKKRKKHS
ncbi:hypothetical protein M0804_008988 [Polistes exclamans]|nr:hypothetical protein M0804_008988 [Polistes exclamans]